MKNYIESQKEVFRSNIQEGLAENSSAQHSRQIRRDIEKNKSETEKTIENEKHRSILNEQQKEVQAKLSRIDLEIKRQAAVQQKLNDFKDNVFEKILEEADSNISENIKKIGGEYVKNVSDEAATLINDFTEVYREVIENRMPVARQKAKKDATENISKFGDENRQLILDSLNQISSEAKKKMPTQVSRLSDLIVTDRFEELSKLEEALNQCFQEVLSERIRENKGVITNDYLGNADELIDSLNKLRDNATQRIIDSAEEKFIQSITEELSTELGNTMKESVRDYIKYIKDYSPEERKEDGNSDGGQ